jgi:ubiquinone/menaquinone biosynthesis C-methylase UbiE
LRCIGAERSVAAMTDGFAGYDRAKRAAIAGLHGTVLEIGAGRGRNFALLPAGVTWIGIEPNGRRRTALAAAARRSGHPRDPLPATAEALPLPDHSVDAVLATVVLCSVRDQDRALAEIARVLRPGGEFVFAEHVAAPPRTWKCAAQRLIAPLSRVLDSGCDPARDTERAIRRSRLHIVELGRYHLPALPGVTVPYIVGRAVS